MREQFKNEHRRPTKCDEKKKKRKGKEKKESTCKRAKFAQNK